MGAFHTTHRKSKANLQFCAPIWKAHTMWICSCHAVNDGQIKAFAKEHGANWKLMTQVLKCGTQCGACAKSAKEILEQAAGVTPKPRRERKPKAPSTAAATSTSTRKSTAAVPATDVLTPNTPDCNRCACACGKTACASLSSSLAALVTPSVPPKTE